MTTIVAISTENWKVKLLTVTPLYNDFSQQECDAEFAKKCSHNVWGQSSLETLYSDKFILLVGQFRYRVFRQKVMILQGILFFWEKFLVTFQFIIFYQIKKNYYELLDSQIPNVNNYR